MEEKARTALEKSIEHWRDVVADPVNTPIGWQHCALCAEFNTENSCSGCPVDAAGFSGCTGSPFTAMEQGKWDLRYGRADEGKLRGLAQAELDFLISLRPKPVEPPEPVYPVAAVSYKTRAVTTTEQYPAKVNLTLTYRQAQVLMYFLGRLNDDTVEQGLYELYVAMGHSGVESAGNVRLVLLDTFAPKLEDA